MHSDSLIMKRNIYIYMYENRPPLDDHFALQPARCHGAIMCHPRDDIVWRFSFRCDSERRIRSCREKRLECFCSSTAPSHSNMEFLSPFLRKHLGRPRGPLRGQRQELTTELVEQLLCSFVFLTSRHTWNEELLNQHPGRVVYRPPRSRHFP